MEKLLSMLCSCIGIAGSETNAAQVAAKELSKYADVKIDKNSNVIAVLGNKDSNKHIMLDAHIDQIGLVVTNITEDGFLKVAPCGGIDSRIMPGSTVKIHGKNDITGIVSSIPPHLSNSHNDTVQEITDLYIDTGLTYSQLKDIISVGDNISFCSKFKKLLNNRVSCCSLDNRAGVASLIRCAQILSAEKLECKVSILLSSQEEVNAKGAKAATYKLNPDEAIMVDVSFASQPDVTKEKSGALGDGPMIGISPSLTKNISDKLISLAESFEIPYQLEVMGGTTGTNADKVSISREGIPSGLLSIPLRYMHTPYELVELNDIENTAKLLSLYIKNGGVFND